MSSLVILFSVIPGTLKRKCKIPI